MVYKPLAEEVALVQGYGWLDPVSIRYLVAVEALGMWESRRDFQEEWEGWKTGFMVFHAFHSSAFPTLVLPRVLWKRPCGNSIRALA
jgi:hypothetical protein